jgi:hypothetical protein
MPIRWPFLGLAALVGPGQGQPQQELSGVGTAGSPIGATARLKTVHHRFQGRLSPILHQSHPDAASFPTDHLRRFLQTAMGIRPAASGDEPVLDPHRAQLGVDLTENAPRLPAAPPIDPPLLFPQFEEQFDRPSQPHHHQQLLSPEQATRHIAHQDGPASQLQGLGIRLVTMISRCLDNALAALGGDLLRNPFHQQTHQPSFLGQHHHPLQAHPFERRSSLQQIAALSVPIQPGASRQRAAQKRALALASLAPDQPSGAGNAQIRQVQTACGQAVQIKGTALVTVTSTAQRRTFQLSTQDIPARKELEGRMERVVVIPLSLL